MMQFGDLLRDENSELQVQSHGVFFFFLLLSFNNETWWTLNLPVPFVGW